MTKAIIIAAGLGTRLRPHTEEIPKILVPVGEKPILDHQRQALSGAGVEEFVIVNGYQAEKLRPEGFRIYTNTDYENNQILESLFFAEEEIKGEVIITYGDLVYRSNIIEAVLKGQGHIRAVVDLDWAQTYDGRDQNPFTDAELVTGTPDRITAIGKNIADAGNCRAEFTGILYLDEAGAEIFRGLYRKLRAEFESGRRETLAGVPFRKAYLSHLLQELILRGEHLYPVDIHGGWVEIDTAFDYERAQNQFGNPA